MGRVIDAKRVRDIDTLHIDAAYDDNIVYEYSILYKYYLQVITNRQSKTF